MLNLTVLCVTKAGLGTNRLPVLRAQLRVAKELGAEYLVVADGKPAFDVLSAELPEARVELLHSAGFVESILDKAVELCSGKYIFRIDDDELFSEPLRCWLRDLEYLASDHWQLPRAWLAESKNWNDPEGFYYTNPHLWPDMQTRLSVKSKAGGRTTVHAGSPYGGGQFAPVPLIHLKFRLCPRVERERLVQVYDSIQPGAGTAFRGFYIPEELPEAKLQPWVGGWDTLVQSLLQRIGPDFPMAQHLSEVENLIGWLLPRGEIKTVIEIGTQHGGTSALWCELATERVISVDLPSGAFGGISEEDAEKRNSALRVKYPMFRGVLGDSHDPETVKQVRTILGKKRADVLFIDGDHSYSGVKGDMEAYKQFLRPNGVIIFHDIVDTEFIKQQGVEVYKLWAELKESSQTHEFVVPNGDWGGIGVVDLA